MSDHQWFVWPPNSHSSQPEGPINERELVARLDAGDVTPEFQVLSPTRSQGRWYLVEKVPALLKVWKRGRSRQESRVAIEMEPPIAVPARLPDESGFEPWIPSDSGNRAFAPAPSINEENISHLWRDQFLAEHAEIAEALGRLQKLRVQTANLSPDQLISLLVPSVAFSRPTPPWRTGEDAWQEPGLLERLNLLRYHAEKHLNLREVWPFQLAAVIGLLQGKLIQLPNGAGKSLTGLLASMTALNSVRAVHAVTINDYLAERDAQRAAMLGAPLGLSSFVLYTEETPGLMAAEYGPLKSSPTGIGRRAYPTDSSSVETMSRIIERGRLVFGKIDNYIFHYLRQYGRDTALPFWFDPADCWMVVDEADSVLLDNFSLPHQLSTQSAEGSLERDESIVRQAQQLADKYLAKEHYEPVYPYLLTQAGLKLATQWFGGDPYSPASPGLALAIRNALGAKHGYQRGNDYLVEQDEYGRDRLTLVIDGRRQPGRRYSDGLQEALMVREGLPFESAAISEGYEITRKAFVNLYGNLSAMTATAFEDEAEYDEYYGMPTLTIPAWNDTHLTILPDGIYRTKREKLNAAVALVSSIQQQQRSPVLVACETRTEAQELGELIRKSGVKCRELLAEHHAKEAEIILAAGMLGAVTISAGMAGRGTDIQLSPESAQAGGLFVIGLFRSFDRRHDQHLQGRAGRRGLPGTAQFLLSLQDDLLKSFYGAWVSGMLESLGMREGESIESSWVHQRIIGAQSGIKERSRWSRRIQGFFSDALEQPRQQIFRIIQAVRTSADVTNEVLAVTRFLVRQWTGDLAVNRVLTSKDLEKMRDKTRWLLDASKVTYVGERVTIEDLQNRLESAICSTLDIGRKSGDTSFGETARLVMFKELNQTWCAFFKSAQKRYEESRIVVANTSQALAEYVVWCENEFFRSLTECAERILQRLQTVDATFPDTR